MFHSLNQENQKCFVASIFLQVLKCFVFPFFLNFANMFRVPLEIGSLMFHNPPQFLSHYRIVSQPPPLLSIQRTSIFEKYSCSFRYQLGILKGALISDFHTAAHHFCRVPFKKYVTKKCLHPHPTPPPLHHGYTQGSK